MFSTKSSIVLSLAAAVMLILGFGLNVQAQQEYQQEGQQQQYQQEMMQQQQAPDIDVSDAELDQVADAYQAVTDVRERFQQELGEVSDPERAQELQQQAGEEMVEAVEAQGLDVQTYNQVMEAAQVDEELRNQLLERLEGMQ
ncbi:DUF4168 domain-containing protein [Desulfonatronospira sp. MSAO_Bac3]|uniref:DUF4168 domain-containing protein n=1 Tax=Desulfonatronospira sp. MSAO_Bac3 TaxID=2293857 RepID=UPI000FF42F4A|nr:DUF4168 domain-containing protein [Desulfonatronospira sp. MSAO_Bac3]RQD78605.1 MAG: DUF4168 domain-containing protein [Desulfonatronospira sp. MSAO_Bac3]